MLREPKSGKKAEVAYMPEAVAKRISDYIRDANLELEDLLFPICYSTARAMIRNLGSRFQINPDPVFSMNHLTVPYDRDLSSVLLNS